MMMNSKQEALFKEREISGFIDLANEEGFDVYQYMRNHATTSIKVRDKKEQLDVLTINFVKFLGTGVPDNPFNLINSNFFDNENGFDRLTWLLKQSSKLIATLRHNTAEVKPAVEDKKW